MTTFATAASIRAALLDLHEIVIDEPAVRRHFGGALLIRELTAAQRIMAAAAARADNPDEPDVGLLQAMYVQMAVVDPASGTPYADGRVGDDGQPRIDPRTRAPLFTAEDVAALVGARQAPVALIVEAIENLGQMAGRHL